VQHASGSEDNDDGQDGEQKVNEETKHIAMICFTYALLMLYPCFTHALLMLYSCFTHSLEQDEDEDDETDSNGVPKLEAKIGSIKGAWFDIELLAFDSQVCVCMCVCVCTHVYICMYIYVCMCVCIY
jgi:hypothetical protein